MSDEVVRLCDVERHYRTPGGLVRAVDGIDLVVSRGECVAVMGPSGSGKSTLLSLLGGLEVASSGTVEVLDIELSRVSAEARAAFRRQHVGFVFQDYDLLPFLTAAENISLVAGIAQVADGADPAQLLARLGLDGAGDRVPDQLSGGQQQRVGIARCLASRPDVVLGDEPTGSLDSETSEAVTVAFLEAVRDLTATAIVVTHDERVAAKFDRVVSLADGKIVHDTRRAAVGVDDRG